MGVILAIWRFVPLWAWVAAAALVSGWLWLGWHDHAIRTEVRAEVDSEWAEKQRAAQAAFDAKMQAKRGEVADLVLAGVVRRDAHAAELRQAQADHDERFAALAARRSVNVTQKAIADCSLTRGVVLQFNAGAARANGASDAAAAPDAGAASVDASAGVALDRYARAVEDTQSALGTCRLQVTGWQKHWADVTAWYASLAHVLDTCFPTKGSP
jgi:hypothetical protein